MAQTSLYKLTRTDRKYCSFNLLCDLLLLFSCFFRAVISVFVFFSSGIESRHTMLISNPSRWWKCLWNFARTANVSQKNRSAAAFEANGSKQMGLASLCMKEICHLGLPCSRQGVASKHNVMDFFFLISRRYV